MARQAEGMRDSLDVRAADLEDQVRGQDRERLHLAVERSELVKTKAEAVRLERMLAKRAEDRAAAPLALAVGPGAGRAARPPPSQRDSGSSFLNHIVENALRRTTPGLDRSMSATLSRSGSRPGAWRGPAFGGSDRQAALSRTWSGGHQAEARGPASQGKRRRWSDEPAQSPPGRGQEEGGGKTPASQALVQAPEAWEDPGGLSNVLKAQARTSVYISEHEFFVSSLQLGVAGSDA
jgi:hypothetical protein